MLKTHLIAPFFCQSIGDFDYELKFALVYIHVMYVSVEGF